MPIGDVNYALAGARVNWPNANSVKRERVHPPCPGDVFGSMRVDSPINKRAKKDISCAVAFPLWSADGLERDETGLARNQANHTIDRFPRQTAVSKKKEHKNGRIQGNTRPWHAQICLSPSGLLCKPEALACSLFPIIICSCSCCRYLPNYTARPRRTVCRLHARPLHSLNLGASPLSLSLSLLNSSSVLYH